MTLEQLATSIAGRFQARAAAMFRASIFIKIVLVIGGTAIAGAAQFMAAQQGPVSYWQVTGIAATVLAGIGALYTLLIEQDSSKELEAAREGIERARAAEARSVEISNDFASLKRELEGSNELYNAVNLMRGVCEQALASPKRDLAQIIKTLLKAAERPLPIALGFQQSDRWTLCVYQARTDPSTNATSLHCFDHRRSIDCEIAQARIWPEGVGVGGATYANAREMIVPDILDPALGSIFDLGSRKRSYDDERYRSFAAVPVMVDRDEKPWGVVIATNDRPSHFYTYERPGFRTIEPVRALAGMLALGISVSRTSPHGGRLNSV